MAPEQKTIMIVDDEPDARDFVETVLEELGNFKILSAADGESAVAQILAGLPDLVILDVMMPGKDGFQVFYEIRQAENAADIPVIMLTGVSRKTGIRFSERDMGDYLGAGPVAFLDKPMDPNKLQETVKKALGR